MRGWEERRREPRFRPGFRFSTYDAAVLAVSPLLVSAAAGMHARFFMPLSQSELLGLAAAPVLAFFLFCNVFRVRRWLELLWAAAFVGLAAATIRLGVPSGTWAVALASLLGAVVIAAEMLLPGYHGVGWRWINPGLPEWWRERQRSQHPAGVSHGDTEATENEISTPTP